MDLGCRPTAQHRRTQVLDPVGEQALGRLLGQGEAVIVPGREVADVQRHPGEAGDLGLAAGREEAVDHAPLVQDLQRTGVQAAGAAAEQILVRTPLDDHGVHAGQRQFGGQHQSRRAAADDQYGMLDHVALLLR